MTATAPPAQQGQPTQAQIDAVLAAEAAIVLAQAVTVAAALILLLRRFRRAGIPEQALEISLDVVMRMPPETFGFHGSATANMSRLNLLRRAQFMVACARRVTQDLREARSRGEKLSEVIPGIIDRERRYYGQHLQAMRNRMNAASQVDSAASTYGNLLGWNTVIDSHTSPECRRADHKNFLASNMPLIGYPGAVHPHCRCWPGRPFPGAALLPSAGLARRMIAA
jgi:hypothetical protein